MSGPNCRCNETDYVSLIQDRSCANCEHPSDGLCTEVAGTNYGHYTEISDDFYCTNWVKEN